MAAEMSEALGADFQIGARPEDDARIAELIPPPSLDVPLDAVPADHPMRKTFAAMPPTPDAALAEWCARRRWRRKQR
jgi:hypothetical protein